MERALAFPLGHAASLADLEFSPHELLALLREREPVSWVTALDGWLVSSRALALEVMRDAQRFTVDDPRFTTGRVLGPSMLTLDGAEHERHRAPFAGPFRLSPVRERFTDAVTAEAERLLDGLEPSGQAELRVSYAGPLAAAIVCLSLGLQDTDPAAVLGWYAAIVDAVTQLTAGRPLPAAGSDGYARLRAAIDSVLDGDPAASLLGAAAAKRPGALSRAEVQSNAAVLMFGGIETTEGMILNAVWHLLSAPDALQSVRADPALVAAAVEESLRLEPAAAVVDRYATRDCSLGAAAICAGELVRVSITAANRDPVSFPDPDRFDLLRANARQHIAFAHGPHVCIGMHLARLEANGALAALLRRLPRLRLAGQTAAPSGLVFRKPAELHVSW